MNDLTKLSSLITLSTVGCIILLSIASCATESGGSQNTLQEKQKNFVGKWKKISSVSCAAAYPDDIEFFTATYLGKKGSSGQRFIVWDAGGYQVLQGDLVKIDTATDQQVLYKYSISQDILTFVDPTGCEFQYRKIG